MLTHRTKKRTALHGIALGLTLASTLQLAFMSTAGAQPAPADEEDEASQDEDAECMPSRQPHECADRCPSFDTCSVSDNELLYYRVGDERFDCDGLDCSAASETLGDYCCRRGEFAPGSDSGGGCAVAAGAAPAHVPGGTLALGALAALGVWLERRARGESRRR